MRLRAGLVYSASTSYIYSSRPLIIFVVTSRESKFPRKSGRKLPSHLLEMKFAKWSLKFGNRNFLYKLGLFSFLSKRNGHWTIRLSSTARTSAGVIARYRPSADHLLLDSVPNIGPIISRWELDKFRNFWHKSFRTSKILTLLGPLISCWELDKSKNCWNKSFRSSKILTLLYNKFSNSLISQRDMSGPRLGTLSNNRWSGSVCEDSYVLNMNTSISHTVTFAFFRVSVNSLLGAFLAFSSL